MKRAIFKRLPKWLQKRMIRNSIDLSKVDQNEIQYKLAETESEFKQAFRLVHDNYVKQGFISPQASQMRMIPHHQLESTAVIVAKMGETVVGTLTLVREGLLGLPMEVRFDLGSVRRSGHRIAEVTCLAIDEKFRRAQGGQIFPYLMKYMYEFAVDYFGVDQLAVAVFPKDAVFYEGLLCFQLLDNKPVDYFGAPAVGLHLDLTQASAAFQKVFGRKKKAQNLFQFFFLDKKFECFSFPKRIFGEIFYPQAIAVARRIASQLPQHERISVLRLNSGCNSSTSAVVRRKAS